MFFRSKVELKVNAKGNPIDGAAGAGVKFNQENEKQKNGADTFKSKGIHIKPHLKTEVSAFHKGFSWYVRWQQEAPSN